MNDCVPGEGLSAGGRGWEGIFEFAGLETDRDESRLYTNLLLCLFKAVVLLHEGRKGRKRASKRGDTVMQANSLK